MAGGVRARRVRDGSAAAHHLDAFLAAPPQGAEAERWIRHARTTLAELRGETGTADAAGAGEAEPSDPPVAG